MAAAAVPAMAAAVAAAACAQAGSSLAPTANVSGPFDQPQLLAAVAATFGADWEQLLEGGRDRPVLKPGAVVNVTLQALALASVKVRKLLHYGFNGATKAGRHARVGVSDAPLIIQEMEVLQRELDASPAAHISNLHICDLPPLDHKPRSD